jgi:N-methylhydantoinase A
MGQDHTMPVNFASTDFDDSALKKLRDDFDKLHHSVHGHSNPQEGVELVNIRLTGLGRLEKAPRGKTDRLVNTKPTPIKVNDVIFHSQSYATNIYNREDLTPGMEFSGPAIIEELTATTVVPPQFSISVDAYSNLLLKTSERGGSGHDK